MNNPRLANRYAKSLIDLASERNQLDAVCNDMKWLKGVCKSNPDFAAVLRSPVIKAGKKEAILKAVVGNNISELSNAFITLLVNKSRENAVPEIANAFVEQYNAIRNIHNVKLTTATPISDDLKNAIVAKVKQSANIENIELETAVRDELIGGFLLETGGTLVDASILRDLQDVKKQFLNNDYIHKIR